VLGYVKAYFRLVPMLAAMVTRETAEGLELSNGAEIAVGTNSYRAVRGRSIACAVFDELAFWRDESSASSDKETYAAVMPGLATLRGMLVMISSPYRKAGLLYQKYRKHFGQAGDDVLVVQAASRVLNPTLDQSIVDEALEEDPSAAAAEWLAQFRSDIEGFVSAEVVDAVTMPGRFELAPMANTSYVGFVDPSGGSADSFTLAIAHRDHEATGELDCVREVRPPFSPDAVVEEFATLLQAYRVHRVTGDAYSGQWVRERFAEYGVTYEVSERNKSAIYGEVLPLLNARRVLLLDSPRLRAQLVNLERRTSRAGKDSIDHAPGGHDDLANAASGALVLVAGPVPAIAVWERLGEPDCPHSPPPPAAKTAAQELHDAVSWPRTPLTGREVVVRVPRPFQLTIREALPVALTPGTYPVAPEVASHHYAAMLGVTRFEPPWPLGDVLESLPALIARHLIDDADTLALRLRVLYGDSFDADREAAVRTLFEAETA